MLTVLSVSQVARQYLRPLTAWWPSRAASRSSPAWCSTDCWSTARPRRPCRPSARMRAPSAWRPRMACSTTARSRFANVSAALAGRSTASGSTGQWDSQVGLSTVRGRWLYIFTMWRSAMIANISAWRHVLLSDSSRRPPPRCLRKRTGSNTVWGIHVQRSQPSFMLHNHITALSYMSASEYLVNSMLYLNLIL